jgi:hypothetical protein
MLMPKPDSLIIARRAEIIERLRQIVPGEGVIGLRIRRAFGVPADADDCRAAGKHGTSC